MNELCLRFPMVAAHNSTAALAVACPEVRHADSRGASVAAQSPITIYDMSTGFKTKVLVLSGGSAGSMNPLAPIAQVRTHA